MVASTSSSAPLITVFGSTGTQGGSVIDHLISSDKPYRIRAVTRDPSKASGKKLQEMGCEVVKAEISNKDDVKRVINGSNIVFGVTNFWEHGAETEIAHGKNMIEAVKANLSTIKTFVWSGVENVSKVSGGKYTKVEHFDTKGKLTELARTEGLPVINVSAAMYMENFLGMMAQEDGSFVLALPIKPSCSLHLLHTRRDYGAYVVGALESGKVKEGKGEVLACAEVITVEDVAKQWGEVNNVNCSFYQAPVEQFQAQAGEDLTQMFQWFQDFGYYGGKDVKPSQEVLSPNAKVQKWRDFVKESDWSEVLNGSG
ncbi:hypothetical protein QFC22_004516 [Naganishia vaughanmartiniae]|uniref:Uncharacterized protein n=1 Tax=Naganishia vaughanmartiniae TaxID=1424756 RepID=A0ACC2WYH7_9TREE|nr:hypothetical protein QFC22_004516 [Naganishia vaughanmartiniae]